MSCSERPADPRPRGSGATFFPPPLARPFIFASYGGRAEAHGAKAGRADDPGREARYRFAASANAAASSTRVTRKPSAQGQDGSGPK
jgi:hypothetical protein